MRTDLARPDASPRRRTSLALFFLRTWFFRPSNHAVLPVAVTVILFFGFLHSIERTHICLVAWFIVVGHALTGGMFRNEARDGATGTSRFLALLPCSRRSVVLAWMAAGALYAAVATAVVAPALRHFVELPPWRFLRTYEGTDAKGYPALIVEGTDVDGRGLRHDVTWVLPRSLPAEVLRLVPRAQPIALAAWAVMLVYGAGWQLFREIGGSGVRRRGQDTRAARHSLAPGIPGWHGIVMLPLSLYTLSGAFFAAEYVIPPEILQGWYRAIPRHGDTVIAGLALFTCVAVAATILMVARLLREPARHA